jgi:hypothetical protein
VVPEQRIFKSTESRRDDIDDIPSFSLLWINSGRRLILLQGQYYYKMASPQQRLSTVLGHLDTSSPRSPAKESLLRKNPNDIVWSRDRSRCLLLTRQRLGNYIVCKDTTY